MTNTKVKIHYDSQTGIVKGNFPNKVKYNYPIPTPFIEIEESEQDKTGKMMMVVDGVYQEYIKPDSELLEEAKKVRISTRTSYLSNTDWYITREADEPNSYPQEIKDKRILARTEINQLEQPNLTLQQVEAFNIEF